MNGSRIEIPREFCIASGGISSCFCYHCAYREFCIALRRVVSAFIFFTGHTDRYLHLSFQKMSEPALEVGKSHTHHRDCFTNANWCNIDRAGQIRSG
jgi:hypothetical protein